jgi:hypothetical protein
VGGKLGVHTSGNNAEVVDAIDNLRDLVAIMASRASTLDRTVGTIEYRLQRFERMGLYVRGAVPGDPVLVDQVEDAA